MAIAYQYGFYQKYTALRYNATQNVLYYNSATVEKIVCGGLSDIQIYEAVTVSNPSGKSINN